MIPLMSNPLNHPAPRGTLKRFIQDIRKSRRKTQEAFAEELKVSRQTVANWESGKFEPTSELMEQLTKWAVEAGMSATLATQGQDASPDTARGNAERLVKLLRMMTTEQQLDVVLYAAQMVAEEAQANRDT